MLFLWYTFFFAVVFWTCSRTNAADQCFYIQPNDTTVTEGGTATFDCVVHNVTCFGCYLAWSKGSTTELLILVYGNGTFVRVVSDSLRNRLSITGNSSLGEYNLNIVNVTKEDEDKYQCVWYKPTGTFSDFATLTVLVPPSKHFPECLAEPATINLTEGTNITLLCRSEGANPQVELEWTDITPRVNNTTVIINSSITALAQWALSRYDNGKQFECIQSGHSAFGDPRTCRVNPLNVWYRPSVTIEPSSVTTDLGSGVNFTCCFDANPEPIVKWYINDVEVEDPDIIRANNTINYELRPIGIEHNNTNVTCTVQNSIGMDSESSFIHILVYESNDSGGDNSVRSDNAQQHTYTELVATMGAVGIAGIVIIFVLIVFAVQSCGTKTSRKVKKPGIICDYDGFKFYDFRAVQSGMDNPIQDKYELTENISISEVNSATTDDIVQTTIPDMPHDYDYIGEVGNVFVESVSDEQLDSKKDTNPEILSDHGAAFTHFRTDDMGRQGSFKLASFGDITTLENDASLDLGDIEIIESDDGRSEGDGASGDSESDNQLPLHTLPEPHYFVLEQETPKDTPVATISDEGTMATNNTLPASPDIHHYESIDDMREDENTNNDENGGETPVSVHYAWSSLGDRDHKDQNPARNLATESESPRVEIDTGDHDSVNSIELSDTEKAIPNIYETTPEMTLKKPEVPGDDPDNAPSVSSDIIDIIDNDFDFLRLHETDDADICDDDNDHVSGGDDDYIYISDQNEDNVVISAPEYASKNESNSNTNTLTSSVVGSLSDTESIHSTGDNDNDEDKNTKMSSESILKTIDTGSDTSNKDELLKNNTLCTDIHPDKPERNVSAIENDH
ncbi:uncharacterized protein LOC144432565 [Glandiceps talaboti]